jgi:hypothetical protein
MTIDNYNELINPRKHIKNIRSSLELVTYDNHVIYKILLVTFKGSVKA